MMKAVVLQRLRVPKGATLSRKDIDNYTKFVSRYGARGLAYIKVNSLADGVEGLNSPILKFLPDEVAMNIMKETNAEDGDLVFFGADKTKIVNDALGALREQLAKDLELLRRRLGSTLDNRLPNVRMGRQRQSLASTTPSVYRSNLLLLMSYVQILVQHSQMLTIWLSTATKSAVARFVSTTQTCNQPYSKC